MEAVNQLAKEIGRDKIDKTELETKLKMIEKELKLADTTLDKIMKKAKENIGAEDFDKYNDQLRQFKEFFNDQLKYVLSLSKINVSGVQKKDVPKPPVPPTGLVTKTISKVRGRR